MNLGIVGQAVGLFAVTNIDDVVVLALFFAQGAGRRHAARNITVGQYVGFAAIVAVAVTAAFGATFLPERVVPYLGLLPLAIGVRAAVRVWRHRGRGGQEEDERTGPGGPRLLEVAAVTFANGGDNIGVYVPVFATAGIVGMSSYVVVFLALLALWIAAGRYFATRPVVARALSRWGHLLLPMVLIGIGVVILVDGGAFGL
ncbi:cadmium resistance transporter [Dactylosporangium sp. CA-139066]|uniref:cadmium resistance transporter n=1 Tax=Dactylosporangium sp. CA-139066 TaxID=3239930 RepID=UPI003D9503D6